MPIYRGFIWVFGGKIRYKIIGEEIIKKIVSTILVLGTILSAKPTLTADVDVLYDAYTFGYEGSKKNKNPLFMKAYCKGAYLGGIHQTFYININ